MPHFDPLEETTSLKRYCLEIKRYPILNPEEVRRSAERMYQGHQRILETLIQNKSGKDYLRKLFQHNPAYEKYAVHSTPPISLEASVREKSRVEEASGLMKEIFDGGSSYWLRIGAINYLRDHPRSNGSPTPLENALNQTLQEYHLLVNSNLRWVVKVAFEEYHKLQKKKKPPILNLIQQGNIGLMRAVDKFDPDKGKITTYATWWIKQEISRAIPQDQIVTQPEDIAQDLKSIHDAQTRLLTENKNPYDYELLSKETGIGTRRIRNLVINEKSYFSPLSLDFVVDYDDSAHPNSLGEEIVSGWLNPEEEGQVYDLSKELEVAMRDLSDRERAILKLRFGFSGRTHTLEEVGQRFELTRERIRQIEAKALEKLREKENLRAFQG